MTYVYGRKGNGTTVLVLMDGDRTPMGVLITAANESEVIPIERLLETSVVPLPEKFRLLYDGAADSGSVAGALFESRGGVDLSSSSQSGETNHAR